MADTRPSRLGGVTDCRNVVVEITHRIGPTPSRKKLRPASHGVGMIVVSAITVAATPDMVGKVNAADLARDAVIAMGGKGAGGKPDFAQGGAPDGSKAEAGLEAIRAALKG